MCYVPGLNGTLVSLSCLAEQGWSTTIAKVDGVNAATLTRGDDVLLEVPLCDGLYQLPVEPADQNVAIWQEDTDVDRDVLEALMARRGNLRSHTHAGGANDEEHLHRRCGHVSWGNKRWARRLRRKYGKELGRHHTMSACEACMLSKMTRIVSRGKPTRPATRPLQRVHFDLSPSVAVKGMGGWTGFCLLVDEYTGKLFVRMIKRKSEVAAVLKEYKTWAENHFRQRLGEVVLLAGLRSDNESVNVSGEVADWCKEGGISHERSAAYEQWQNGVVERSMRTVWEGSEAMRKDAGAPDCFWPHTVDAFVHVFNRLALGDSDRSPHEKWNDIDVPGAARLMLSCLKR